MLYYIHFYVHFMVHYVDDVLYIDVRVSGANNSLLALSANKHLFLIKFTRGYFTYHIRCLTNNFNSLTRITCAVSMMKII